MLQIPERTIYIDCLGSTYRSADRLLLALPAWIGFCEDGSITFDKTQFGDMTWFCPYRSMFRGSVHAYEYWMSRVYAALLALYFA